MELKNKHSDLPAAGDATPLEERNLLPMDAVNALYSEGDAEIAEAIVSSLSKAIFDGEVPKHSSGIRRFLARPVFRLLKRTTKKRVKMGMDGEDVTAYKCGILEKSGHPYAMTLLEPSKKDSASFVEGGDPMNAPYMMISPEIKKNASTWDELLLDSVQGRDVQIRFIWETKLAYEFAKSRLDAGKDVKFKAVAAGTGLSPILVFDRLMREGYDASRITAMITDRESSNVAKTERLLQKLSSTREHHAPSGGKPGISAVVEDLLHMPLPGEPGHTGIGEPVDIATLVGILEYFPGYTCSTTDKHRGERPSEGDFDASEIVKKLAAITEEGGILIANSYHLEMGARIIEIFGKRIFYRNRENLQELAGSAGYVPSGKVGSGCVYDVEAFEKRSEGGA